MADICDLAQEHIELEAPLILAASKKPDGPKPNGVCHNCGESICDGTLFCDTDCRDDWERTQRAIAQRPTD